MTEEIVKRVVARSAINDIRCPVTQCSGMAFISLSLNELANIRAAEPKICHPEFSCSHKITVSLQK